ncbi:MAG: alpha/beta hydrolase [Actinobacteria bacterium]|nr:MAG: alpha/beta hydrolase [Actinomycetota bacterium]
MKGQAEVPTPFGPALVALDRPAGPARSLLVLGHGAGGGVDAPDLLAVRAAVLAASVTVARVTQPYRVRGRRAPAPAGQLDEAWTTVVSTLSAEAPHLILGGRSSGARVACRTARALGAAGVVALAFPLHPPGRPDRSRADELDTGVPTLVVNGDRDPFGMPEPGPGIDLCVRPGERHDLRRDPAAVGTAVLAWLVRHGWAVPSL